jgi:endonuclease/exonuclease/phosphatase family metal-dependent hydrolase
MMMGLSYTWLLIVNLVFVALWGISRMKYWWYSAACILLGWNHVSAIYGFSFTESKTTTNALKLMTYNIDGVTVPRYSVKKDGYDALNTFLETENPDILCLQEFAQDDKQLGWQLDKSAFLKAYPYQVRLGLNSVAILSKYPVEASDFLPINKNGGNGCIYADINIKGKKIRIYCVHLQSNSVSNMADKIAEQGDLKDKSTWMTGMRMIIKVRKSSKIRAKEAETIAAHSKNSPMPSIICGDFNEVPVSYAYHTLSEGKTDAFKKSGQGNGTTYRGNIPLLKIDYILADKKLKVSQNTIHKVPYSDHFPTSAVLSW